MPTTWLHCLTIWISVLLPAVGQPIGVGPDRRLDPNTRTNVTKKLLQQINGQYVFPTIASQIDQTIQTRLTTGEYDQLTSCQAFADTITAQLQQISHDKHLRLFYHHKPSPPTEGELTVEQLAARRQYGQKINFGFGKPTRLAGNIGYLRIDEFMPVELAAQTATDAMNFLSQTDALILDLQHNRGGEPAMVAYLASYFFGPDSVHLNDIVSKGGLAIQSFWTNLQVPGGRYGGKALYILTGKETFSAGEEFAYDLQSLKRATVIGESTAGGAHAGEMVRIGDHFTAFIPVEYARNPITQTNWEGTGVKPDIDLPASQAQKKAHLMALETIASKTTSTRKKRKLTKLIEQQAAVN